MTEVLRVAAFGKQAASSGRALPFSESLGSLDEAPEPLGAALREALGGDEAALRLMILSPAFATVGQSSPENLFALTNSRWILAARTPAGVVCSSAPFSAAAVIELTMILLGGQLRIDSVGGAASCAIGFNMVSIDLFREALFMIMSGASPLLEGSGRAGAIEGSVDALSFKFNTALKEQTPPGQALRAVCSWTSEVPPLAWLMFLRPAAPAGVLALTDRCLCVITDPAGGKDKQPKGKSPHGKVVTYLLRHHPITLSKSSEQTRGDGEFRFSVGTGSAAARFVLRVPVRQMAGVGKLIEALR
jgi:hypothetical protein